MHASSSAYIIRDTRLMSISASLSTLLEHFVLCEAITIVAATKIDERTDASGNAPYLNFVYKSGGHGFQADCGELLIGKRRGYL